MRKTQIKLPSIGNIILVVLLTLSILAGFSSTGGKKLNVLGYRPVLVVSGSMLPSIEINSLSIMKYCSIDEVEVGDVVMYYHPRLKINITHRAIDKYDASEEVEYLIVKGDANNAADDIHVTDDMLVGKLVATYNQTVPFVNLIIQDGQVNSVALLVIIVSIAMILTIISLILNWIINILAIIVLILFKKWSIEWYTTGVSNLGIESEVLETSNININRQDGDSVRDIIAKINLALQINKMVATSQDINEGYKFIRLIASKKLKTQLGLIEAIKDSGVEDENTNEGRDQV